MRFSSHGKTASCDIRWFESFAFKVPVPPLVINTIPARVPEDTDDPTGQQSMFSGSPKGASAIANHRVIVMHSFLITSTTPHSSLFFFSFFLSFFLSAYTV